MSVDRRFGTAIPVAEELAAHADDRGRVYDVDVAPSKGLSVAILTPPRGARPASEGAVFVLLCAEGRSPRSPRALDVTSAGPQAVPFRLGGARHPVDPSAGQRAADGVALVAAGSTGDECGRRDDGKLNVTYAAFVLSPGAGVLAGDRDVPQGDRLAVATSSDGSGEPITGTWEDVVLSRAVRAGTA